MASGNSSGLPSDAVLTLPPVAPASRKGSTEDHFPGEQFTEGKSEAENCSPGNEQAKYSEELTKVVAALSGGDGSHGNEEEEEAGPPSFAEATGSDPVDAEVAGAELTEPESSIVAIVPLAFSASSRVQNVDNVGNKMQDTDEQNGSVADVFEQSGWVRCDPRTDSIPRLKEIDKVPEENLRGRKGRESGLRYLREAHLQKKGVHQSGGHQEEEEGQEEEENLDYRKSDSGESGHWTEPQSASTGDSFLNLSSPTRSPPGLGPDLERVPLGAITPQPVPGSPARASSTSEARPSTSETKKRGGTLGEEACPESSALKRSASAGEKMSRDELEVLVNFLLKQDTEGIIDSLVPPVTSLILKRLINTVRPILLAEPVELKVSAPVYVCGDIHGQFHDLVRVFSALGWPPGNMMSPARYLFLGDYVDRGRKSMEVVCLLFALKCLHPLDLYLLRGNHEEASCNRGYGLYFEFQRRLAKEDWKNCYVQLNELFECLSICANIDGQIFCMHGGIGPDFIRGNYAERLAKVRKPIKFRDDEIVTDLLWADPGFNLDGFRESSRGISYEFGGAQLEQFLALEDFDLIVRAHEVVQNGYEFFCGKKLVTVFTAPDYSGEYDNDGAIMRVQRDRSDQSLSCGFIVIYSRFRPRPKRFLASGLLAGF